MEKKLAPRRSTTETKEPWESTVENTVLESVGQVREPARVSFSYERTFQQAQYQPVKVAAWISISAGATQAEIDEALETYSAVGDKAVAELDARFEEIRARLGEAQPAPKATRSNSSAPSQPASSGSRNGPPAARSNAAPAGSEYEKVEIGGRTLSIRNYINNKGEPSVSTQCFVDGCATGTGGKPGRASFSRRVGKNGQEYSALDNLKQAVLYKGGAFCYNHRDQETQSAPVSAPRRAPAPAAFADDDESDPF